MRLIHAQQPAVVTRPVASAAGLVDAVAVPAQPLLGRRILVVEDEMLILMDVEDMLADLGCAAVVTAATVSQAIDLIDTEILDAALLDLNLDGDRTYAVADALRRRRVPFAFATGYGSHGIREHDIGQPMLVKPYLLADLARTMAGLLKTGHSTPFNKYPQAT